jgi:uncharacterized alkaline shock family protein YloU
MKQFNLLLACVILLSISSLCFYIILWHPDAIQRLIGLTLNIYNSFWGKVMVVAVGFICAGCGISLLAAFLGLDPNERQHIILEQEGGAVGVSLDAIEEFIKRKGQAIDGVRDLAIKSELTPEGLAIQTRLTLELQKNVPEFIQAFQGRVYHELTETLGVKDIKEVKVLIHKITPKDFGGEGRLLGPPASVLLKEPEEKIETEIKLDQTSINNETPDASIQTIEIETIEPVVTEEDKS